MTTTERCSCDESLALREQLGHAHWVLKNLRAGYDHTASDNERIDDALAAIVAILGEEP